MLSVAPPLPHLVFAYYITGHGFGHATRALDVRTSSPLLRSSSSDVSIIFAWYLKPLPAWVLTV